MSLTAGVVAVQGDVAEHVTAIERAGQAHGVDVTVHKIRTAGIVPDCDLLALPGGESTTISRLIGEEGIDEEIRAHVAAGKPLLATCAGLIVASRDAGDDRVDPLELVDVTVERNAFGRQKDSFEAMLSVAELGSGGSEGDGKSEPQPFPAVFIRAPVIIDVGDVDVLASVNGRPVAVRDGPVIATAFHPELTGDWRLHQLAFFAEEPTIEQ